MLVLPRPDRNIPTTHTDGSEPGPDNELIVQASQASQPGRFHIRSMKRAFNNQQRKRFLCKPRSISQRAFGQHPTTRLRKTYPLHPEGLPTDLAPHPFKNLGSHQAGTRSPEFRRVRFRTLTWCVQVYNDTCVNSYLTMNRASIFIGLPGPGKASSRGWTRLRPKRAETSALSDPTARHSYQS